MGCLLLFICVGVAALAAFAYSSSAVAMGSAMVDRIAYVDNDLNIQVVDSQGGHRVALTNDASSQNVYMYPTFSPDSQHVSFVGANGDRSHREGTLLVAGVTGEGLRTLFKSDSEFPFYMYWSPDNQRIGFLAQSNNDMSLLLGTINGNEQPQKIQTASPVYWAWSPDGHTMLMHMGGDSPSSQDAQLALVRDGQQPQKITDSSAAFLAPQFSPDGKSMLYASKQDEDHDALFLATGQGSSPNPIVTYSGAIAFAWSPDGTRIASLVTPDNADLPVQGPIFVSDASGQNRKQVVKEDAIAFYWAPNGKQIAYLTLVEPNQSSSQSRNSLWLTRRRATRTRAATQRSALAAPMQQAADIQLQWHVVNLVDGRAQTLATFTPTDHFISLLPFFDQYARSVTFWSPDSQHLVYSQQDAQGAGSVWVADMAPGSTPRKIADGTLAVWSWR